LAGELRGSESGAVGTTTPAFTPWGIHLNQDVAWL
jgi:hypothetical protein